MAERDIEISGGAQLERIVKALREVNKDLKRELVHDLRDVGRKYLPKVRQAIDAIPSKHDGTLRGEMKAATRVQFRSFGNQAGMVIRVDGRKMPSGRKSLPGYVEGTKPRWRHPVFGDTENWTQQPSHPFFFQTLEPAGEEFHRDINAIAQKIARKLQ